MSHRTRAPGELRPIEVEVGFQSGPDGSVLITWGGTKVLCSAFVEEGVAGWRLDSGLGWVTAQYAMLPGSTHPRHSRERGKPDGRSTEIGRLVGRSLRQAVDMEALGPRTVRVDCDVIQADGGTRCAAITGGQIALELALAKLVREGLLDESPVIRRIVAVSAGLVDGEPLLDLDYGDDSQAQVDANFVFTRGGDLVEIQGTGEGRPFTVAELGRLLELAASAVSRLAALGDEALAAGLGR